MSAYAEICSMFEQRRKVEEEYASAAYSQLLTFVELFEFYRSNESHRYIH